MSFKKAGSGDDGTSSLYDGTRSEKDSDIFEVLGTLDEINSLIGVILQQSSDLDYYLDLEDIQRDLIDLGSHVATPRKSNSLIKVNDTDFSDNNYLKLEKIIKEYDAKLPKLTKFILPRGPLQYIRAVIRRAERRIIPLIKTNECSINSMVYLNRLSDLFFVLGRYDNRGVDIEYKKSKDKNE